MEKFFPLLDSSGTCIFVFGVYLWIVRLSVCVLYVIKPYMGTDINYIDVGSFENIQVNSSKISVLKV